LTITPHHNQSPVAKYLSTRIGIWLITKKSASYSY
jgi:hypothetical protein